MSGRAPFQAATDSHDGYLRASAGGRLRRRIGFGLHNMAGNAWEWCSDWLVVSNRFVDRDAAGARQSARSRSGHPSRDARRQLSPPSVLLLALSQRGAVGLDPGQHDRACRLPLRARSHELNQHTADRRRFPHEFRIPGGKIGRTVHDSDAALAGVTAAARRMRRTWWSCCSTTSASPISAATAPRSQPRTSTSSPPADCATPISIPPRCARRPALR